MANNTFIWIIKNGEGDFIEKTEYWNNCPR